MTKRTFVQEAARLSPGAVNGVHSVVLITEGEGSSGRYSAELLKKSAHVFENAASFINHPIDPSKPHMRDLNSIAGRISNVRVGEDGGKVALLGDYKPRAEYASLFEDFGDVIGLSIFCSARGESLDDGRLNVQEFDANDPYRSVDAVVAAGRGGKFVQAQESLRAIESSLGAAAGKKPGATSAQEQHTEENYMDPKAVAEALVPLLAEAFKPMTDFLAEEGARRQAEADAKANEPEVKDAIEAFAASTKAIEDAKLPAELSAPIVESAKRGEDVTAAIEAAKTVWEAATKAAAAANPTTAIQVEGYVHEGAQGAQGDVSYTIPRLGGSI